VAALKERPVSPQPLAPGASPAGALCTSHFSGSPSSHVPVHCALPGPLQLPGTDDWLQDDEDPEDTKPTVPLAGHSGRATKASAGAPRSTAPISECWSLRARPPLVSAGIPDQWLGAHGSRLCAWACINVFACMHEYIYIFVPVLASLCSAVLWCSPILDPAPLSFRSSLCTCQRTLLWAHSRYARAFPLAVVLKAGE